MNGWAVLAIIIICITIEAMWVNWCKVQINKDNKSKQKEESK